MKQNLFVLLLLSLPFLTIAQTTTPAGTTKAWGQVDGVTVEGYVQSPSNTNTPLQVACIFEYTENDIFTVPPALPAALNGMVHLDNALHGTITNLRKTGMFSGHAFETILITPSAGSIPARQLLLIGLGSRAAFKPELMSDIAQVALREALRLGVDSYCFASDLKDGGVDSPTADVAGYTVEGTFKAYRAQAWLKSQNMSNFTPLTKVSFLAGPSFFTTAGTGIQHAIDTLNKKD